MAIIPPAGYTAGSDQVLIRDCSVAAAMAFEDERGSPLAAKDDDLNAAALRAGIKLYA